MGFDDFFESAARVEGLWHGVGFVGREEGRGSGVVGLRGRVAVLWGWLWLC